MLLALGHIVRQPGERTTDDAGYRRAKETKRGGMGGWQSEPSIVPAKPGNRPQRDPVEGRDGRVTEPLGGQTTVTLNSGDVSTKLQRIAELAREHPERAFMSLNHVIDVTWLREAYGRTRKDGALGVDGQTAAEYAKDLEANLQSLAARFHSGGYRAPLIRRTYIPKGDGVNYRALGIPTFEDKILQRAVAMVLEAIYEQDFRDCSYGFRPRRSAHQALEALRNGIMSMGGGWIIDLDVKSFFDELGHAELRSFLDRRVTDGTIRRVIDKWLNAGVLEDGAVHHPESGSPQGGVISPMLANVYLHEVLDAWFEREIKPRLRGRSQLVRYADDGVLVFEDEADARRVMEVLPQRFGRFGLRLHPEKTRLIRFERPGGATDSGQSGSFDFLGFTHYWAKSRRGFWVVKRKTSKARLRRALRRVAEVCRWQRHHPVKEQHQRLVRMLRGHYNYYGITGNSRRLAEYQRAVAVTWRRQLARRSQRAHRSWHWFHQLLERYPLLPPRIVHSAMRTHLSANP